MARFTQEEYEIAKNTSLLDYLQQNGYRVKQKGREFCLEEHDSLMINPEKNTWFWWSRGVGGGVIQFLEIYEDKTLVEAVNILNNKPTYMNTRKYSNYETVAKNEKGKLILPPKNENTKRVFAYLSQTRKIDPEIINFMIKNELIYESADKHEVVFLGRDNNDEVKFACKRATLTNSLFKQDVENSSKEYGFKFLGKSDRVFVFESNIDLLSHCTMAKMQGLDWKKDNRLSLGGVSDRSLEKFLEENENIKEIVLFLDNDETGLENSKKISKKYGLDYKVSVFSPKHKDLNETLINLKENPNLDIRSCIQKIKIPFIEPKTLDDNSKLIEHLENITENDTLMSCMKKLIESGVVKQTADDKIILFLKDKNCKNIGAYEWELYDKRYNNLKLVENSEKSSLFFDSLIETTEDTLFISDNIIWTIYFSHMSNSVYINSFSSLEDIKTILDGREEIKDIIFLLDKSSYIYKDYQNENNNFCHMIDKIKNYYPNMSISIEENFGSENLGTIIKDEYIRKPFKRPEVGDSEELYQKLLRETSMPKNKILEMFRDGLIYQDVDRNMIFLIKDAYNNDIGGYSLDIYNQEKTINLLVNSDISEKQSIEMKNFISYIYQDLEKSEIEIDELER